ncbi:hypothetical protein NDN08_003555 [Rhodosorus marinus]|uniref:CCT domain-containing protein n=1 Tax=Rhodosorus marinus TaxID=101924 RepID=A0AAV8V0Z9_9RHOD|nr:hypothetical protein NDN08_003555 [Rhodosorus marinus]
MGYGKLEDMFFDDIHVGVKDTRTEDELLWGLQGDLKSEWDGALDDDNFGDAVVPTMAQEADAAEKMDALVDAEQSFSPISSLDYSAEFLNASETTDHAMEVMKPLAPSLPKEKPMSPVTPAPSQAVPPTPVKQELLAEAKPEMHRAYSTPALCKNDLAVTPWNRQEALERYRRKKANRCFKKKIRYQCRKRIASDRPRVGGRFARIGEKVDSCISLDTWASS